MNKSKKVKEAIDLVYLWVDGDDPKWLAKKQLFSTTTINTLGRYKNNEELKYSLRSVEKHIPWINNIFIVTDNQVPFFLDINHPKIKIIDHSEIIPADYLPCFNSGVIEYFIYKIPGLSELFIFSNDDMLINSDIAPTFFFKKGKPIVRMMYKPFFKWSYRLKRFRNKKINTHRLGIENANKLIEKKLKKHYKSSYHHNVDAYLKSNFKEAVEKTFREELTSIFSNRFRDESGIHRTLINYYSLYKKQGYLKYINRKESYVIDVHKGNFEVSLARYNPKLFCLNDTEYATDEQRASVAPFLEKLFPKKSSFEK